MVGVIEWVLAIGSFFCGSLPFGVWIAKSQGVDILATGSGNPGATNVFRTLGAKWGLFCFALDLLKGLVPSLLARHYLGSSDVVFAIGLLAVLGHTFSPWIGFKGGKGVATGLGVVFGLLPSLAILTFLTFVIVLAATRYVSMASMIGASVFAGMVAASHETLIVKIILMIFAGTIIYRHRSNIERLRAGTEPKFQWSRSQAT